MKRLLFIYNPQAGKGAIRSRLAQVVELFTRSDYLVTVWPTQEKEDATRVASRQGWWYDRVICCGGDGTLSETASGLLTLDVPPVLGYIPSGTTNDFSRNLRLPRGIEKAAAVAAQGVPRPCDMGKFNGSFFVYVAAFGAFTDVSYATPQELKSTFGHLAYLLEGATKLGNLNRSYPLTIEHDEGVLEGEFIYGMVSNTDSVGGFKFFPPSHVALDDGVFEVILIRKPTKPGQLQDTLLSLARQAPQESRQIVSFHTSKLKVSSPEPLPWTLDGEYGGSPHTAYIENLHRAITLVWGK